MNIKEQHSDNAVSAFPLFKGEVGSATAIQIQSGEQLKEHITKSEAMLICLSGSARFENEKGMIQHLNTGDYVRIEPMVKHWVDGIETCQLVLLK